MVATHTSRATRSYCAQTVVEIKVVRVGGVAHSCRGAVRWGPIWRGVTVVPHGAVAGAGGALTSGSKTQRGRGKSMMT